ncbi:hypothetical protein WJX79_009472 [Trebouxia sp. C0005]
MASEERQMSASVTAAAFLLGLKDVSNVEVFAICSELAQGRVLPAGWTSGYDNQNRQYFVDEVKRESTWHHPLLPYYRGAVYMALGGKAALAKADATKPCTDAEVRDMAEYLGIDMDTESDLLDVARMAVAVPTPPGWQQLDNTEGFAVFRNLETGQEQEAHPLDEYFAELIRRRRLAQKPEGTASTSAVDSKQAGRAASTLGVDSKQAGRAAVQAGAAKRQQSAKPRGKNNPRSVEKSASEASSSSSDVDEDDNSADDASSGEEEEARPVPSGSSSSCWTVDPSTGVVTLNASQTTAKRKQAQHGQGVLRSSNSNGSYLDGGLSRGLLSSAPSTPNVWDPSGMSGTSMGYKFDQVLNEDAKTAAVYASCIQSLVQSALAGINGTVLAYGQTGSGKTHTIMGERHEAGAIALAIDDIFATTAAAPADQFAFRVDMVEIYNEELRDLLAPVNAKQKKQQSLQIKEDPMLGVRPSLGGNARTAIIATINPSADQMEETSHTLRLASRAMAVTNRVSANEVMSDGDLAKQYQSQLNQLRHHLSRRESGEEQSVAVFSLKQQVQRLEDQNLALALQLETATGRSASDWGSIPATPSGLSLPNQFAKASRSPTSAEQALKLIARTTALNRPTLPSVNPSSPSGPSSSSPLGPSQSLSERLYGRASADDVVQSVRRLRAERDQLRLRDRDHARSMHQVESQLFELEQLQQQQPRLQQATMTLEDLLGSTPLPDFHHANSEQAQPEEARSKQLEADLVQAKASVSDRNQLAEQLAQAQLSHSTASGVSPTGAPGATPGASAAAPPGGVALQLVKVLQQQVQNLEGRLAAGEKHRKALKKELAQWSSLEAVAGESLPFPVGSVAVRQARQATLTAHQAEQHLAAAVAERDSLARQVEELKPPEMQAAESPSDAELAASPEAALQRVKKRVYALSSEVAHLTRERDMLRIQFGQQPGPTLPAGSVRFHTPGHVYPGPPSSSSPGQPLQMPLVQSNSEVLLPTISGRLQDAVRSPGAVSSLSSRDGILSLPAMLGLQGGSSRQTTASIRSSGSKKKSKRGKASSKGVRAAKGPKRGLAAADSASLSGGASADWTLGTSTAKGSRLAAESSGSRADWVDPTRSEDVPVQEVGALKKRLVASERERKQALADAAAENRALQLQLQALSKAAQHAEQLDEQVTDLRAQQMQTLQFNEALQAQRVQDAAQLKALLAENEKLRIHK